MRSLAAIVFVVCLAAAVNGVVSARQASDAPAAQNPSLPTVRAPARDPYQRSVETYEFTVTAKSGAQRGEELFYFKCSICHNRYGKPELMRDVAYAPRLERFVSRQRPRDGQSAADVAAALLRAKVQSGSPRMPSYRYALSDADVADLIAYVTGTTCCVDGDNPPANPNYRHPSATASSR